MRGAPVRLGSSRCPRVRKRGLAVRVSRYGWALVYLVATVVAQGVHDHGGADAGAVQHEAGCSDPRPHLSGHWSPDLGQDQDHCLACQFRANHHGLSLTSTASLRPSAAAVVAVVPLLAPRRLALRNTCRAPPRPGTA